MAGLLEQLLGGRSLGGGLTGVGATGPEVPFGGVERANEQAGGLDPKMLAALGFLGGGGGGIGTLLPLLSGQSGGQAAGGGFGGGLGGLLSMAQGQSPQESAGGLGILGLLAGLGK